MDLADRADIAPPTPEEPPPVRRHPSEPMPRWPSGWQGPTYYGRAQLKAAPFENGVVGGYIFFAGLSGASALLSTIASTASPRASAALERRARWLTLLAPVLGAPLLIYDLHTPKRFYNMLRVAKGTSPMSIGTWILSAFSASAFLASGAGWWGDRRPNRRGWRRLSTLARWSSALAGAGLSTYTAALLSATSTPLWAAAPRSLAARFGASSMATGAASLALGQRGRTRRNLDAITAAALAAELTATLVSHHRYSRSGIAGAFQTPWGRLEEGGATALGLVAPLAMYGATLARGGRSPLPALATLAGSLLFRISIMGVGDVSARDPELSFRFAQPDNLPGAHSPSRASG